MRFIGLFAFILLIQTSRTFGQDLETYQWKNRIILLRDVDLNSDWLNAQLKRLQSNQQELDDRDLLLFLVTDNSVYNTNEDLTEMQATTIINKYDLTGFKGLVLIGKDGGIKLKEGFIVNPSIIFELIDGMPMRMTELKNKG